MASKVPNAKSVGRPPRLSVESIIATADRILQSEGSEKLSMRHLANELGSAPMALYHHVRDKDELLVLVLEAHARRMPRPEFVGDPRERLVAASVMLYEMLAERPWIVEVLTGDDLIGPSALWIVEVMIAAAVEYGHTPEHAFYVYRTIWYYIVGNLIIQVNSKRRRARTGSPIYQEEIVADLASGTHPQLAAVAGRWAELNDRDSHREGLQAIVDGLMPAKQMARSGSRND